jgi:pSer/pThr/pTyr-binding forkhead associated (FHA) protein
MTSPLPLGDAGEPRPTGSASAVLAWLWGEQGQVGEYLLAGPSVTLGRGPGSDIVLSDPTVSREHARFEYEEGQWWLRPADSASPTWVNGRRAAPGQRLPVTDGDRLRFGFHTQMRLLVPGAR